MKPEGVSQSGRAYRIAICDDKKFEVSEIKLFLSSRGFYVQVFENARLLVDHVKRLPGDFDLLVLDIVMPVLDGFAAFHELRQTGRFPRTMFISVENTPAVIRHLLESGAADYVVRPFTKEALVERMKKVLSRG